MKRRDKSKDEWQFLVNVGTSYELELITALLAQERILVMKKSKGSGAYTEVLMGTSLTGYDIYVPTRYLAQAREILDNMPVFEDDEIDQAAMEANTVVPESATDISEEETEGFLLSHKDHFKLLLFIFIFVPLLLGLAIAMFR